MSYILKPKKDCLTKLRNDWERLYKAIELINKIDPYLYLANGQAEYLEQVLGSMERQIKQDLETIEKELLDDMKTKEGV